MSNSILYLNGRYLSQWNEFEEIILNSLNSNKINNSQDEIFASLRDGVVYDWMVERDILNADHLNPKHFINTTDSNVRQYLMRFFGNREEAANSLNLGEHIELMQPFFIIESTGIVSEGIFNGISKLPEDKECVIEIEFKVKKAANEEFSINVIGEGNKKPVKLDILKINTRTKASIVPFKLRIKDLISFHKVAFEVDGNEILSFKLLPNNWIESKSKLVPKRPRQIIIVCDRSDARLIIPKYGNEILKKGENTILFTDCPNLIEGFGFDGNKSSIKQILLYDIDTSQCKTMHEMFRDCNNISQLFMGRFNTSNVLNLSGMFRNCASLKTLDLYSFDTSKVVDMSFMFCGCRTLASVNVARFDTSKVEDMHMMFFNCSLLTSIDLQSFDTSRVTNMSCMFSHCESLSSLNLMTFKTINVTNMSAMFKNCSKIRELNLSSFNTSNVNRFSETFLGCSNLISLNISGWVIKSAYNIFSGCEKLKTIHAIGCSLQTVDIIKQQLSYAGLSNVHIITERPSNVNGEDNFKSKGFDSNLSKFDVIDMGTSVYWCNKNIGATSEIDGGEYFSWGKLHSDSLFIYYDIGDQKQVKQKNISGSTDFDAATSILGIGYRLPTIQDWKELLEVCDFRFKTITIKGQKYIKLVSRKTGNQLLLPILGHMESDVCQNSYAQYWTSEQNTGKSSYICQIHDTSWDLTYAPKWCGLPIRPVYDPQVKFKDKASQ